MNANDMEKTIEIPEGYEARIEGNKVILEPKESKDEKIMKELLEVIRHCYEDGGYELCTDDYKKYSAYLERQKGIVMHTPRYATPEQKEQKSIQDKEEREYVRTLKSLIADFLRDKDEVDRGYYQKIYDWLDGRHIEQQLAEWSEEDEDTYERVYSLFNNAIEAWYKSIFTGCFPAITKEKVLAMFKSLRPQPHWKPSEEVLAELTRIRDSMPNNEWGNQAEGVLDELIDNLKKL